MSAPVPERGLVGLHAGSRMPDDGDEVDALLRQVPEVAFLPEIEASVFSPAAIVAVSAFVAPAQIIKLADDACIARLRAALEAARARAQRESNGGLQFLATTLGHFLDQMPPDRHPLIVALWCRAWARRLGQDDVPEAIAVAMDDYESTRGSS
jgi:hypothetical protein